DQIALAGRQLQERPVAHGADAADIVLAETPVGRAVARRLPLIVLIRRVRLLTLILSGLVLARLLSLLLTLLLAWLLPELLSRLLPRLLTRLLPRLLALLLGHRHGGGLHRAEGVGQGVRCLSLGIGRLRRLPLLSRLLRFRQLLRRFAKLRLHALRRLRLRLI